jgi:hypothetical protein
MQYKILREDKVTTDNANSLATTVSVLITIGLILYLLRDILSLYLQLGIVVLIIYFIPKYVRTLSKDWVRKKDIIGYVEFENERIYRSNNLPQINVDEITRIQLDYNYIKGKKYNLKDVIHNGLAEFHIDLKDGSQKKIVFVIESKKQFDNLSKVLKEYYRKQIEIKEFFCQHKVKTVLLRPSLNYKELQDFKKELNVGKI